MRTGGDGGGGDGGGGDGDGGDGGGGDGGGGEGGGGEGGGGDGGGGEGGGGDGGGDGGGGDGGGGDGVALENGSIPVTKQAVTGPTFRWLPPAASMAALASKTWVRLRRVLRTVSRANCDLSGRVLRPQFARS